jgi:hypothetical protein
MRKKVLNFAPPGVRAHTLKNLRLNEVSLVDEGANPFATVILAKHSDRFGFDPVLVQKIAAADEPMDIDPDNDGDIDFQPRPKKGKRKMKKLAKRLRKALADSDSAPTYGGDDSGAIVAQVMKHAPVAMENWTSYARRVFGDAVTGFTPHEHAVAKSAFAVCRQHSTLREAAGAALEALAKSVAAETGRPWQSCYAEVCKSQTGSQLYDVLVAKIDRPNNVAFPDDSGHTGDDGGLNPALAAAHRVQNTDSANTYGNEDLSPGDCAQVIHDEAARIQDQHPNWSGAQCFTTACQRHPTEYHRARLARAF